MCKCKADGDCLNQDDGDQCNGLMFCNKQNGKCELNPASVVSCQTVGDTSCKQTLCQPKSGQCVASAVNEGKGCDDGSDGGGGSGPDASNMDGAGLDGAGLDGAGLDGAGLDGAGLDGAGLDGAGLDGAGLDGAGTDGSGGDGSGASVGAPPPSVWIRRQGGGPAPTRPKQSLQMVQATSTPPAPSPAPSTSAENQIWCRSAKKTSLWSNTQPMANICGRWGSAPPAPTWGWPSRWMRPVTSCLAASTPAT
ncbi:MAG: hypothetical protein EXR77_11930 [Myxococcales bacterium]|nr:hypothetical protein [Myxococcales bacterium]